MSNQTETTNPRIARVYSDSSLETIQRYLPGNYEAVQTSYGIFIIGYDNAGWGLDTYVIPRLASGLHTAKEITVGEETNSSRDLPRV